MRKTLLALVLAGVAPVAMATAASAAPAAAAVAGAKPVDVASAVTKVDYRGRHYNRGYRSYYRRPVDYAYRAAPRAYYGAPAYYAPPVMYYQPPPVVYYPPPWPTRRLRHTATERRPPPTTTVTRIGEMRGARPLGRTRSIGFKRGGEESDPLCLLLPRRGV